jgi:hypothetical protein
MGLTAPLPYDGVTRLVEDMIKRGVPFAQIEDTIDDARLSPDHKAALWLLAWSLRDPAIQRRDARLTLKLVSAGGWGHG